MHPCWRQSMEKRKKKTHYTDTKSKQHGNHSRTPYSSSATYRWETPILFIIYIYIFFIKQVLCLRKSDIPTEIQLVLIKDIFPKHNNYSPES